MRKCEKNIKIKGEVHKYNHKTKPKFNLLKNLDIS